MLPLILLQLCQLLSPDFDDVSNKSSSEQLFLYFLNEKSPANIDLSITWESRLTLNYYSTM